MAYNQLMLYAVLVFLVSYFAVGIFPIANYETDALGVLSGSKQILMTGVFAENYYTYSYQMQPGIYALVILFHKLFKIDLIHSYSLISALFGILFYLFSALFITRLLNVSFPIVACLLLLFQEVYSSWYYMNSATASAFFMILGFIIILNVPSLSSIFISSVVLAISAWIRFDVIVVFPTIIFLIKASSFKKQFFIASIVGGLVFSILTLLFYLSNISLLAFLTESARNNGLSFGDNIKTAGSFLSSQMVRSCIGFFSLLMIVLIIIGTFYFYKIRAYNLIAIVFTPIVLFFIILKGNITAGKHLLYYIPFFGILVVGASKYLFLQPLTYTKIIELLLLFCLFVFQYLIGFQFYFNSHPYIGKTYSSVFSYPSYLSLMQMKFDKGPIDSLAVVVGSGMKLATADEMLLSSGIIFSPIMWYDLKKDSRFIYSSLDKFIRDYKKDTLYITASQGGAYSAKNSLYLAGFQLLNPEAKLYQWHIDYNYVWRKGKKYVIVEQSSYPKDEAEYIKKIKSHTTSTFLHLAFWDWERAYMMKYYSFSKVNYATYLIKNK